MAASQPRGGVANIYILNVIVYDKTVILVYFLNVIVYDKTVILVAVYFSMQNTELSHDLGRIFSYIYMKIKCKSQILSLYLEIMMIFLKQYELIQVFNSYMIIKVY